MRAFPYAEALIGLAGAVLAATGDVLILGRACSGRDFDQATGMVPPQIEAEDRWRSLWNGAHLPSTRVRLGTFLGMVGIGGLAGFGLRGASRAADPGAPPRYLTSAAALAFGVSGVLTHGACGAVVLAYGKALSETDEAGRPGSPPRSRTRLLAASTVATCAHSPS